MKKVNKDIIRNLVEQFMARIWDNSKDKNTEKCYDDRDWFLTNLKKLLKRR